MGLKNAMAIRSLTHAVQYNVLVFRQNVLARPQFDHVSDRRYHFDYFYRRDSLANVLLRDSGDYRAVSEYSNGINDDNGHINRR